jgi:hypothetical protein
MSTEAARIRFEKAPDGTFSIHLSEALAVEGFPSFADAAVWVQEYLFRIMTTATADETRKKMLGAAILAALPTGKKKED